ncbi:MAG: hypothetical protein AABZ47_02055 [Planctomycetota bacterium]
MFRHVLFGCAALAHWFVAGGCSIHYFDPETGTEHLWGIGHMKVKVTPANEHVQSVVRGVDLIGFGGGSDGSNKYVVLGWQRRQRIDILDDDASIRLEWCGNDFANVRVGSTLVETPALTDQDDPANSEKEIRE